MVFVLPNIWQNIVRHISRRAACANRVQNVVFILIITWIKCHLTCTFQTARKTKRCIHRNRQNQMFRHHHIVQNHNQSKCIQAGRQNPKNRCANQSNTIKLADLGLAMVNVLVDCLLCCAMTLIRMRIAKMKEAAASLRTVCNQLAHGR